SRLISEKGDWTCDFRGPVPFFASVPFFGHRINRGKSCEEGIHGRKIGPCRTGSDTPGSPVPSKPTGGGRGLAAGRPGSGSPPLLPPPPPAPPQCLKPYPPRGEISSCPKEPDLYLNRNNRAG